MITPRDRVGLVGANGTGKTTLLKILGAMDTLDQGDVATTRGMTCGYLPQDGLRLTGRTVFEECLSVFDHVKDMEREMETLRHSLSELDPASEEYQIAADRYSYLDTEFHTHDGYALEAKVGTVLAGLGFRKEDWHRYTEEFSGGWQMRIALAKLLLEKPNLLLLDEPTNHLDLEARNWLEAYLHDYPFAFVLISHDRYFLDVTVNRIVELWNKRPARLQRQLREVPAPEDGAAGIAAGGLQQSERAHRTARSFHQSLPLPGDEGEAGAKPHQGARQNRAHRGPPG